MGHNKRNNKQKDSNEKYFRANKNKWKHNY